PDDRMSFLIFQLRQDKSIALIISNQASNRLPHLYELTHALGAFIVRVINVLDYCLTGFQPIRVRHMMEKQEQGIRRGGKSFELLLDGRRILPHEACSRCDSAVHANALVIGAVPLAPTVVFRRSDSWAVMASQDVGERPGPERTGVILIGGPRGKEHGADRTHDRKIISKGKAR